MGKIKIGRYSIETSNEDKNLFGKSKITKGDLIAYYQAIAPYMIPFTKNRPLTMLRYPGGITSEGFYQKDIPDYFPQWIKRIEIQKQSDGKTKYIVCNNAATLVYLANQACITPHIWLSKIDRLDYPDQMIFDLDPPSMKMFPTICKIAFAFKELLESEKLIPFVKLTGSRGLHITVPIRRKKNFDEVRDYAQNIAKQLIDQYPQELTMEIRKAKRGKKIFVDTLRNAFAQTAVAPYAVRAKKGAPVAAPIYWEDLHNTKLTSQQYSIKNILRRLEKKGNPWEAFFSQARSIK